MTKHLIINVKTTQPLQNWTLTFQTDEIEMVPTWKILPVEQVTGVHASTGTRDLPDIAVLPFDIVHGSA